MYGPTRRKGTVPKRGCWSGNRYSGRCCPHCIPVEVEPRKGAGRHPEGASVPASTGKGVEVCLMNEVKLSYWEMSVAASIGVRRHLESLRNGLKDKNGMNGENRWVVDIEGVCGEMAFAKLARIYYEPTVNTFKAPDVGKIQVRTALSHTYQLIVRQNDSDEEVFVLVTGMDGDYCVRGWIHGRDAKKQEWLKCYANRPAAYFVPQSELMPWKT